MRDKFEAIVKDNPHILYGGDYNPDQWQDMPEIIDEDMRLMRLAEANAMSVGIFGWKAIEPEEHVYTLEWLDDIMDKLHANGVSVILATPSAARPDWMDKKYPEVLRVQANRVRNLHGERHNHCYTSPYYRKKVAEMNQMLAKRYADHPALAMWHISNEYGGDCHCPLCQEAFRNWLRVKYDDNITKLNKQWWTGFWSRGYSSFDDIESAAPHGENAVHGLKLDWQRFVTYQTTDFMENEIAAVRKHTDNPVTTNLMGLFPGFDPWKLSESIDVVSWDNYPRWHNDYQNTWELASDIAFVHDINRSLKAKPFLMLESTPSLVNWQQVNKLKRPNMNILSSIQAIAHGSDSVQYFQWRKGRGACEKFHGACVDHVGNENTRVFREVAQLGNILNKLDGVVGTSVEAKAAIIYDWDNRWAIDIMNGLSDRRNYPETCMEHYRTLWKKGIATDIINMEHDFSEYKLIIAPMLYMLKPNVAKRLKDFVANGGTLVTTYFTGYVNENDLCFLGGFPGDGMMEVTGIWAEEIDTLWHEQTNHLTFNGKSYEIKDYCELVHTKEGCETLASYDEDFYEGMPVITKNSYKEGVAYHIAARTGCDLLEDLYTQILDSTDVKPVVTWDIPEGVSVTKRMGSGQEYVFVMNFTESKQNITVDEEYKNLVNDSVVTGEVAVDKYEVMILLRK